MRIIRYISFLGHLIKAPFLRLKSEYRTYILYHDTPQALRKYLDRVIFKNPDQIEIGENVDIQKNVRILSPAKKIDDTKISIGSGSFIGENAEIQKIDQKNLKIKSNVSINDGCKIIGDVVIERYSLLSCNIFISSGNHTFNKVPHSLIRLQDQLTPIEDNDRVHIEEDCWIGWGAFIKRGIYIGRGAVIGAYAVVNKDVEPYGVVVGQPGVVIKNRLNFKPSNIIDSRINGHLPYFYRGFDHNRSEFLNNNGSDYIKSGSKSIVVLDNLEWKTFCISGKTDNKINIEIRVNNRLQHNVQVENLFEMDLAKEEFFELNENDISTIPTVLKEYSVIEFSVLSDSNPEFWIQKIELKP